MLKKEQKYKNRLDLKYLNLDLNFLSWATVYGAWHCKKSNA